MEVWVVVHACRDLAVAGSIRRDSDLVAGVLEDGAGGVAGIGAFKGNLEADFEEVLFERDYMVVVRCPCDFHVIVARLREEAGNLDDVIHGNGAGIEGDGSLWLLGGALVGVAVGERAVISGVVQRPGSERRWDLGRSHQLGTKSVGAADVYVVGPSVGFGLSRSETRLVKWRCERRQNLGRSEPQTQTVLGFWQQRGFIGFGTWSD